MATWQDFIDLFVNGMYYRVLEVSNMAEGNNHYIAAAWQMSTEMKTAHDVEIIPGEAKIDPIIHVARRLAESICRR